MDEEELEALRQKGIEKLREDLESGSLRTWDEINGKIDPAYWALSRWRDTQFANLMVISLGIAAQTHPEEVRAALASVFDLAETEKYLKRVLDRVASAQKYAEEVRARAERCAVQIERMEKRLDALAFHLERACKVLGIGGETHGNQGR